MARNTPNVFEARKKPLAVAFFAVIAALLVVGGLLLAKAVRDEMLRGGERYIQLREPRPFQDHSEEPSDETIRYSTGLEKKNYRIRVDEDGYIQPSRIHAKPDRSIVFLGGSTTECQYMGEEERFPYLVGRHLEKELGLKVNSYNTAKAGNNSLHSLFMLQAKVIPLKPKAVVIMECINDLNLLIHVGGYYRPHYNRGIIVNKEYNPVRNFLLSFVRKTAEETFSATDEFAAYRGAGPKLSLEEMCESYKRNLELFAFICRQQGITPVFMTQFNTLDAANFERLRASGMAETLEKRLGMSYAEYVRLYNAMNNVHRIVAQEQGAALIDLDRLIPKSTEYLYDIVHLNANGSRFAATIIAKALELVVR